MSDDTRAALLRASKPPTKDLFSTLITANHILHQQGVVDGTREHRHPGPHRRIIGRTNAPCRAVAYGHISVRNPQNPNTFFLSKSLAPALVAGREHLAEYHVSDASPVDKDAPKSYAERFIHSEIYKKYK